MRFLLDTNVLSEPLKSSPNQNILRKLRSHQADLATATSVWHEMWFGAFRMPYSKKRRVIEEYLRTVVWPSIPVLSYDEEAAEWHAIQRANLLASGKTPPFVDGQIAAIAVVNDLTLVTRNVKDFAPFGGLRVEDWQ